MDLLLAIGLPIRIRVRIRVRDLVLAIDLLFGFGFHLKCGSRAHWLQLPWNALRITLLFLGSGCFFSAELSLESIVGISLTVFIFPLFPYLIIRLNLPSSFKCY